RRWRRTHDSDAISRARLTSTHRRARVTQSSPVGLRVRRTWRFKGIDLLPRREGTSRNGSQSTADALLTMERLRQPVAVGGNGFALFSVFTDPVDLPLIAAGCNPGAP